jgi:peptidoglycan/LPS O-acetylase OafA/YrhL
MANETANRTEVDKTSPDEQALSVETQNLPEGRELPKSVVAESRFVASRMRLNNIGFIRLLAASMVIVSHSAELINGNRFNEPLSRLFGTLSFGELGVDIFFLVSGYLITKSYLSSQHRDYFAKRVNRIYPGYLAAYVVSLLVVGPLAGIVLSSLGFGDYVKIIFHATWLDMPRLEGAFATQHYHFLNGPMWTISYEFRCYLLVMLAGAFGFYKKRAIPVCLTVILLLLHLAVTSDVNPASTGFFILKTVLTGDLVQLIRFAFIFSSGALFFLFRDKIKYTGSGAFLCILSLVVFMFSDKLAEPAICSFGAYALFYFAFEARRFNINRDYDISYGVYLYAWPLAALILLYHPTITQGYLSVFTFVLAVVAGVISWYAIEKPATRLTRYWPKPKGFDIAPPAKATAP